jgi:hypothetical protein
MIRLLFYRTTAQGSDASIRHLDLRDAQLLVY